MIVLDASAILELLLGTELGRSVANRIADPALQAFTHPISLTSKVAQAVRRYVQKGELDRGAARVAFQDLRALDIERHAHEPLLDRVWSLRENLTAYDAVYVALAEALDTVLLTCDRKIGPGARRRRADRTPARIGAAARRGLLSSCFP